ncbi:EF-hand domain-containing protein [Streptomyces sp. NPDC048723]|uniref:EF-hand domain-containing protein n=1 Tax=Streptomyces sp. NPDC048723 TaxID=3365589 RepID=UPI00372294BE
MTDAEAYRAKMAARFHTFDQDGDGEVTRRDFHHMARRVAETFEVTDGSEAGLRLTAAADCYWEGMAGLADTDLDGRITRAEFVTAAQAGLHQDPGAFARIALPWHQAVLDVANPDAERASSTASTVERVLVALGAEPHRARLISAEHRTDPTGRITHEEILREVENYYTTATPQRAFPVPA